MSDFPLRKKTLISYKKVQYVLKTFLSFLNMEDLKYEERLQDRLFLVPSFIPIHSHTV